MKKLVKNIKPSTTSISSLKTSENSMSEVGRENKENIKVAHFLLDKCDVVSLGKYETSFEDQFFFDVTMINLVSFNKNKGHM